MSGLFASNTNLAEYYLATDTPDDDSRRTSQCVQTGHVCCNSCPEREPHIPFLINCRTRAYSETIVHSITGWYFVARSRCHHHVSCCKMLYSFVSY